MSKYRAWPFLAAAVGAAAVPALRGQRVASDADWEAAGKDSLHSGWIRNHDAARRLTAKGGGPKHPAWPTMVGIVDTHGLPAAYVQDFWRHDARAMVNADPKEAFIWAVYPDGTHLLFPDRGERFDVSLIQTIDRNFAVPVKGWYWWDGKKLHNGKREHAMQFGRDSDYRKRLKASYARAARR